MSRIRDSTGPAGLTATLYLARLLRSVTVICAQDGRSRLIPKTGNLIHFPDGLFGPHLLDLMRHAAKMYGAVLQTGTVRSVQKLCDIFDIATDNRTETANNIVFVTSVFNQSPLSSADRHQALSRGLIRYYHVCDACEFRNQRTAVLGNAEHGACEARFI
jgi:thioredoxin reductase (NADPH)